MKFDWKRLLRRKDEDAAPPWAAGRIHNGAGSDEDGTAPSPLAALEDRERRLVARQTEIRELRADSSARTVLAEDLADRVARQQERLHALDEKIEAAEEQRTRIRKHGLLSYAILFGIAAVAFILADIVISRAIVADALALTGRSFLGLDESWYFASALALIAVLLKPAYDRLVEAPYWEGRRRWFVGTILATSALAIVTLGVLGWFRAVAFEAQTMTQLLLDAPGMDPTAQLTALSDLQESIVGSPWGKAAFLLSGILFALAGAISLGISFRHFHDYRHVRWPLRRRTKRLEKVRIHLARSRRDNARVLRDTRMDLQRADVRLGDLPELERIREELQSVRERRRSVLDRQARPRPHVALRDSIRTAFEGGDLRNADLKGAGLSDAGLSDAAPEA